MANGKSLWGNDAIAKAQRLAIDLYLKDRDINTVSGAYLRDEIIAPHFEVGTYPTSKDTYENYLKDKGKKTKSKRPKVEKWNSIKCADDELFLIPKIISQVMIESKGEINFLTTKEAEWCLKISKAAPELAVKWARGLYGIYLIAQEYILREESSKPVTDDLDMFVSLAAVDHETLNQLWESGYVERPPLYVLASQPEMKNDKALVDAMTALYGEEFEEHKSGIVAKATEAFGEEEAAGFADMLDKSREQVVSEYNLPTSGAVKDVNNI